MNLTINQAATLLGKTARQVRYMLKQGRIEARKVDGHWVIDKASLPRSPAQAEATGRKLGAMRAAVERALDLGDEKRQPRFSMVDLKAFGIARTLLDAATGVFTETHAAPAAFRRVLFHLSRGCHRFNAADKAGSYREARDAASDAALELHLSGDARAADLARTTEQDLHAAIAGLLRRVEPRIRP